MVGTGSSRIHASPAMARLVGIQRLYTCLFLHGRQLYDLEMGWHKSVAAHQRLGRRHGNEHQIHEFHPACLLRCLDLPVWERPSHAHHSYHLFLSERPLHRIPLVSPQLAHHGQPVLSILHLAGAAGTPSLQNGTQAAERA